MTVHTQLTTRVRRSLPFVPPLHVSPDGRWLFVYSSYGARVFDAAIPGEAVWSLDVRVSAMVAAGPWVVCAPGKPARLLVLRSSDLSLVSEVALSATAEHMAIDVSGSRVVILDGDGALHKITLDEAGSATIASLPGEPFERGALALSTDGRMAVMSAYKRDARTCPVQVIDLDAMAITHTLKGARAAIIELAIGPDNAAILAATFGLVMAWADVKAKARTILKCKSYPSIVGFADPDHVILLDHKERAVCVALRGDAIVWEHPNYGPASLSAGRLIHNRFSAIYWREPLTGARLGEVSAPPHPWQIALDPTRDVAYIATSAGALIRSWPLGAPLDPCPQGNGDKVLCVAVDSALRWLALGTAEGIALLLDLHDLAAPARVFSHPGGSSTSDCTALYLDPERDHLWGAIDDRIIRWRLSTGELEAQSERQKDEISAMLPLVERGVLVLAARARRRSYGELSVLDLATLDTIHDQRLHHTVNTIERVSADLVTLRSGYGAMSFELNTHTITGFTAHTNLPISAALLTSPSTPRAVRVTSIHNSQTKDYDYTLQLWSTGEGAAPLGEPFACPGIAVSLQWRPDGSSFCIVHHDRALRVWDGETGQLRATLPITVESPLLLVILPDGLRAVVAGYDGSCELITLPD